IADLSPQALKQRGVPLGGFAGFQAFIGHGSGSSSGVSSGMSLTDPERDRNVLHRGPRRWRRMPFS
ncbi:MAG: hypothetical protein AAGD47_10665, partial [Pseudomonadota bacterium]